MAQTKIEKKTCIMKGKKKWEKLEKLHSPLLALAFSLNFCQYEQRSSYSCFNKLHKAQGREWFIWKILSNLSCGNY